MKKEMAQEAAEDEWNNVQTITARKLIRPIPLTSGL